MNRTATLEQIARLTSSLAAAPIVVVWSGEDLFCLGAAAIDLPIQDLRAGLAVDGWHALDLDLAADPSGPQSGAGQSTTSVVGLALRNQSPLDKKIVETLHQLACLATNVLATERELQEVQRAELLESRSFTDGLQAIVVITNSEGGVLDVNRSGLATLPADCDSPIGMRLEDTPWFDHDPIIRHDLRQALDFCTSAEAVRYDTTLRLDRSLVPMDLSLMPLTDSDQAVTHIVCSATDITVRRQIEEHLLQSQADLRRSLSEKETLLREVHHRVKNNLQVISSLLGLQARRLSHQGARSVLDESRERVRAMSMVHEKLYQARDLAVLDTSDYLDSLVASLRSAYSSAAENIDVAVECHPITLGVDQAIPLGLIVNELVSNAFKHAFVGRPSGSLLVQLREEQVALGRGAALAEPARLVLRVADDGIGLEGDVDLTPGQTLGLRLIGMLTEQLNGELVIQRDNGTSFELSFLRS